MENSYKTSNRNGSINNGHTIKRHPHQPSVKVSLAWLDLRVFYVRVSRCEIDDSTPEYLILNHIPLSPDTLLEVNGVRTQEGIISMLLRRDRLDKKTEEATYVSTDSIRVTGSMKFEVFDKGTLLVSGVLDLHDSNGFMTCESDVTSGTSFLKEKHYVVPESMCPMIEVYVAGSFSDATPIVLTKTLHLDSRKKHVRIGGLESVPEAIEYQKDVPPHIQIHEYLYHKPEDNDYSTTYPQMEYMEGEDGELSWFNAGVRVGVGIGLSLSVGLGIGVGLLLRAYQGTTSNFRKRLL